MCHLGIGVLGLALTLIPQTNRASHYAVLVVEPVTVAEGSDTRDFRAEWVLPLHRGLVRQLRKKKLFEEVVDGATGAPAVVRPVASSDGPEARKRAALTATVVLYNKGSRAARFMVGMGAGAAKTRIRFVVRDLDTGEELMKLEGEGRFAGWLNPLGGTNEEAIMESAGDAVDRLVDALRKNRVRDAR
jgi:hypothetical protein